MTNVWKIGSRWGNRGKSVLDLFIEYGCVFFGGKSDGGVGDRRSVRKGDLFVVSDGSVAVAIGESMGTFRSYKEAGIRFRKRDADEFINDEVVLCPARLVLLDKAERDEYWGIDPQKRFCRASVAADKVRAVWEKKSCPRKAEPFSIDTRVVSLLDERDANRLLQSSIKYSIPIYQRPYSWGESELRRLMEDLHQGLSNDDPVFMGTIQLSQPIPLTPDGSVRSHNVIDGQQRLTTFIILLSILEKIANLEVAALGFAKTNFRTSVNKRAAQNDLDAFFSFFEKGVLTDEVPKGQDNNPYIANAKLLFGLVQEFASTQERDVENEESVAIGKKLEQYAIKLRDFISQSIKIVVIETHAGLSKTLKIFDTINSSGLDLGSEDLFKVHFYEYLRKHGASDDVFDKIAEVYERIEGYNRHPFVEVRLSMSHVLASYQRVLIARCGLNASTFSMSQESFFEHLFDTVLDVHIWDDFMPFLKQEPNNSAYLLTINDLHSIVDCHINYLKACDEDPDLKIIRRFFGETRYGYASDIPVLAMVKGIVDCKDIKVFAKELFMSLVPPSIYFGKHVYRGRAYLFDLLKKLWDGSFRSGDSVAAWCRKEWRFDGLNLLEMTKRALDYSIANTPKWKNLICKLVEYIKSPVLDQKLFERLFSPERGFDIEHIQSATAEDAESRRKLGWKETDEELNKIGNLAMFESNLNRSVQNKQKNKQSAYAESKYVCIHELRDRVLSWSKRDAVTRREEIAKAVARFLFPE